MTDEPHWRCPKCGEPVSQHTDFHRGELLCPTPTETRER